MAKKIKKTFIAFYISLVLHCFLFLFFSAGSLFMILGKIPPENVNQVIYLAAFSGIMIVLISVSIKGLKDKKTWAWYFSLITAGLQFLSILFFIFSIIAAVGLLQEETTKKFKIHTRKKGKKLVF